MSGSAILRPPLPPRRRSSSGLSSSTRDILPPTPPRTPLYFKFAIPTLSSYNMFSSNHSSEDSILPLSASSKTSFDENELSPPPSNLLNLHLPSLNPEILIVISLFPLSTALVLFSMSTLPISISWPKNLSDLALVGRELQVYADSGLWSTVHVATVLSLSAVWKHAWSIPGSVVWNVLAGALWSPLYATVLLTALTSLGSIAATSLSKPLAPILLSIMPRAIHLTRQALHGSDSVASFKSVPETIQDISDAPTPRREKFRLRVNQNSSSQSGPWVRLSVLRLIGIIPWSGINIASGISGVPLFDCLLGSFIGSLPWTAVTCQVGDILQTVASSPGASSENYTVSSLLTSREVIVKLALLSFLSLSPILGRNYLKAFVSPSNTGDEKKSRWPILRLSAPKSRHCRHPTQELNELVREKLASSPTGLQMPLPLP